MARHKILESIAFLDNLYRQNQNSQEEGMIFEKFIELPMTSVKSIIISYFASGAILITTPFILNVISPEYQYLLPYFLPVIPTDTPNGFELNTIWQIFAVLSAIFSHAFFYGLNAILVLHVLLLSNILCNKVRIINEMAEGSQLGISEKINNIILLQIEMRS